MTVELLIEVESRPLARVEADLVAAGFFEDERPLRGATGMADWRLCGLLSQLLGQGMLRGELGEAILVPSGGRLRAPRVLFLGLGQSGDFRLRQRSQVQDLSGDAVRRASRLGVHTLALAPLGLAPDEFPRHASAVLEGVLGALRGASAGLRLRILMAEREVARATRALAAAASMAPRGDSVKLLPGAQSFASARPSGGRLPSSFRNSSSNPHRC